jgi:hypothetical protein
MAQRFFVVDTNVLVAAQHPAKESARKWLQDFARDNDASLIVDFESRPGDSAPYFQRQFLPQISFSNPRSHILAEYSRYGSVREPWMRIISDKLQPRTSVIVSVDYHGGHAILSEGIHSRVDPSDAKFVMAAINYIRWHVMGPGFRPTIVYAADYADWAACRPELEREHRIGFLQLT